MRALIRFLRVLVAASILLVGVATPVMGCPPVDGISTMADSAPMKMHQPPLAQTCDMVCLACLVQPEPMRIVVLATWSQAVRYLPLDSAFDNATVAPDVPPPRIWMA